MENQFSREEILIGKEKVNLLKNKVVCVVGIGGVGSYVVEALARAGVGNLVLVDKDDIDITNINRQLIATYSTIGKSKVEVAKERVLDINPSANVTTYKEFFLPETSGIINEKIDYIVDAVDTITAKVELVKRAKMLNIPIICSMGTGNKLDPTKFVVTDINKTKVDPLAKVMRKELNKRGIKKLKVVYSEEEPFKAQEDIKDEKTNKVIPGSISFVPSVAGLIIAGEVIKDLIKEQTF